MKRASLLFAIYFIFLAVYPCSDQQTCVDEQKAGISVATTDSHSHSGEEQDFCTPFCICSCCASNVQPAAIAGISFSNLIHNTQVLTPYFQKPLPFNAKSIWQPPKLS